MDPVGSLTFMLRVENSMCILWRPSEASVGSRTELVGVGWKDCKLWQSKDSDTPHSPVSLAQARSPRMLDPTIPALCVLDMLDQARFVSLAQRCLVGQRRHRVQ